MTTTTRSAPPETPNPYDPEPLGRPKSDPAATSLGEITIHAECLHPKLIDRLTEREKWRDKWRVPITLAVCTAFVSIIFTVASILYTQGAAAGATNIRVDQVEGRAREDRATVDRLAGQQRQRETEVNEQRTELIQALHAIDSRLSRIEERVSGRPAYKVSGIKMSAPAAPAD